jgi:hypothetical protein
MLRPAGTLNWPQAEFGRLFASSEEAASVDKNTANPQKLKSQGASHHWFPMRREQPSQSPQR